MRSVYSDFSTADAEVSLPVIDDTELAGGDALDFLLAVDMVVAVGERSQRTGVPAFCVAHLEADGPGGRSVPRVVGDEMKVCQSELMAVLQFGIVAV